MSNRFSFNLSRLEDIKKHFELVSKDFTELLQTQVQIDEYLEKLSNKSSRIEIWDAKDLVGLLCFYILNDDSEIYITHVSVVQNREKQGIGQLLLEECLKRNRNRIIKLEVSDKNIRAISLYTYFGFERAYESSGIVSMLLKNPSVE